MARLKSLSILSSSTDFTNLRGGSFSRRYLNFSISSHSETWYYYRDDRAFLLSHPKYHQKNLELVINTLLNNDYPLSFIFDTIND